MKIDIRAEHPNHHAAIRQVVSQAFAASPFGDHGEADLVDSVRDHCDSILALVALDDSESVVGHVLFSPVEIHSGSNSQHGFGLGPVAVAPDFQNQGVASRLIEDGMNQLQNSGCPFVTVLGDPSFYRRFGFEEANKYGVKHGFAGIPQEVFSIRLFDPGHREGPIAGNAFYRPEFGVQHQPE